MTRSHTRPALLLAALLLALVASCSALRVGYNQADLILAHYANDYFDLDRTQRLDCEARTDRLLAPRDPEARFVWYSGCNQTASSPNRATAAAKKDQKPEGEPCYGYRTLPLLLADPNRRFHLTLLEDFLAANEREEVPATALLLQLPRFYPDLHLDAVAGDAGFGYEVFLQTVYTLGAKRVVDLRAHTADKNKAQWPVRGYDDRGRPVCPYGYAFTANGFDASRQRYKWFCGQACLHGVEPLVSLGGSLPGQWKGKN